MVGLGLPGCPLLYRACVLPPLADCKASQVSGQEVVLSLLCPLPRGTGQAQGRAPVRVCSLTKELRTSGASQVLPWESALRRGGRGGLRCGEEREHMVISS